MQPETEITKPTKPRTLKGLLSEDNVKAQGHWHPHVGAANSFCWGTAQEAVVQALDKLELMPILNAARTILENYNPDGPYVTADRFVTEREKPRAAFTEDGRIWISAGAWGSTPSDMTAIEEDDDGHVVQVYRAAGDEETMYYLDESGNHLPFDPDTYGEGDDAWNWV